MAFPERAYPPPPKIYILNVILEYTINFEDSSFCSYNPALLVLENCVLQSIHDCDHSRCSLEIVDNLVTNETKNGTQPLIFLLEMIICH